MEARWPGFSDQHPKVKRRRVVSSSLRSGSPSVSIFDYEQCAADQVQQSWEEEEERGALFDKLFAAAKKKHDAKKATH